MKTAGVMKPCADDAADGIREGADTGDGDGTSVWTFLFNTFIMED